MLRRLGYKTAGGNWRTMQKYAMRWEIPYDHFEPFGRSLDGLRRHWRKRTSLAEILVENSSLSRRHLKERLFADGVKERRCELCGQDEEWRGSRMALILDHINGVPTDNRLENLRIACPNCAATFKTHCGRKNRAPPKACVRCGSQFFAKRREQRYCSRECGIRYLRERSVERRVVKRPPYEQLVDEIHRTGYLATGRRYGVSDNAIRKWVKFYENEIEQRRTTAVDHPVDRPESCEARAA